MIDTLSTPALLALGAAAGLVLLAAFLVTLALVALGQGDRRPPLVERVLVVAPVAGVGA